MFTISLRSMFRRAVYRFSTVGEKERRACEGTLMSAGQCRMPRGSEHREGETGDGGRRFIFSERGGIPESKQTALWRRCRYPVIDLFQSLIVANFKAWKDYCHLRRKLQEKERENS